MAHALEPFRPTAEMTALATSCCPGLDAAAYLAARTGAYQHVAVAREGGALVAFQLVAELEVEGARHVYLGPLFSRGAACLPLFLWLFGGLEPPFHLMIEAQSPRVALLFKRLFPQASWPRLDDAPVPPEVLAVARRFERLPQVGRLDPETLSTRNAQTLYQGPGGYGAVVDWMGRRGVDLARGDAQAFLVSAAPGLRREVRQGARALLDWPAARAEALSWFTGERMAA